MALHLTRFSNIPEAWTALANSPRTEKAPSTRRSGTVEIVRRVGSRSFRVPARQTSGVLGLRAGAA